MTGPADAALLAAVAIGCVRGSAVLGAARWPRRSPGAAILLWQALGLGGGLAAVGALSEIGLPAGSSSVASGVVRVARMSSHGSLFPVGQSALPVLLRLASLVLGLALLGQLCWVLLASAVIVLRARRRQRELLALLGRGDPKAPGALVVDHPAATAYCRPGLRSRIVVSVGALDLLDSAELAAVLAHERAHLRERHDLVLLPFVALLNGFAWSPVVRKAHQAVALLIEMHADDMARRHRPARELATALLRVGAAGGGLAPSGALAAADPARGCGVTARGTRLLRAAAGLPAAALALVALAATAAIVVPAAVLVMPF